MCEIIRFPIVHRLLFLILIVIGAGCDTAGPANIGFDNSAKEDLFFLQNDGAIMPIRVMGNKQSDRFVIFLHGGPGGNVVGARDFLAPSFAGIEEDVAMVYWDQRCAGASQGNCNNSELSFEAYSEDLDKVILLLEDHYGDNIDVFLMSHSFGGWLATMYLSDRQRHDRISGWIDIDGAFNAPMLFAAAREQILAVGARQVALGNSVDKWQRHMADVEAADLTTLDGKLTLNQVGYKAVQLLVDADSLNKPEISVKVADLFRSPGAGFSAIVNNASTEASDFNEEVFSRDDSARLRDIDLPVLLVWGKYDLVVPPAVIDDFRANVSSTDVTEQIFDRSEHSPFLTEPQAFVALVRGWLAERWGS